MSEINTATASQSSKLARGGILSLSTSKPRPIEEVIPIQSPKSNSALPQPSPHRTFSGPAAVPASASDIQDVLNDKSRSPITPKSAGYQIKGLRFEKGDDELKTSKTAPAIGGSQRDTMKRRHTVDPRVNIHTECGRHSDDWLFGGWTVTDTMKKIWDKKESKP